jgi:hypothetical protein
VKKKHQHRHKKSASPTKPDAWAIAEAYGCDMNLLEASLRRTPQERIEHHDRLLTAMEVDMGQTSSKLHDLKLLQRLLI